VVARVAFGLPNGSAAKLRGAFTWQDRCVHAKACESNNAGEAGIDCPLNEGLQPRAMQRRLVSFSCKLGGAVSFCRKALGSASAYVSGPSSRRMNRCASERAVVKPSFHPLRLDYRSL